MKIQKFIKITAGSDFEALAVGIGHFSLNFMHGFLLKNWKKNKEKEKKNK